MAGSDQVWNSAYELIPADGDHPKDLPQQFQDHKVTIRTKLEKEHIGSVESSGALTGEHKAGSAKLYSQSGLPTTRPDGSPLTSVDSGRLWHNTNDNSLTVLVDDGAAGVEPKHLFEGDDIDDSQDPKLTLVSLQQKIDALAFHLKQLYGGTTWNPYPVAAKIYFGSNITGIQFFTFFDPIIPGLGDSVQCTGGFRTGAGSNYINAVVRRTGVSEMQIGGFNLATGAYTSGYGIGNTSSVYLTSGYFAVGR